jgi:hypothetical protein
LRYFDLPDMDAILDNLQLQIELVETSRQKVAAARANPIPKIITPPDQRDMHITASDGSFEQKLDAIPRAEMIAYLLAAEFGVDLHSPEDFSVVSGILPNTSRTMRPESYDLTTTRLTDGSGETHLRYILSCDATYNATFVVDGDVAQSLGINAESLMSLTKSGWSDLLDEHPKLGRVVNYGEVNWLARMKIYIETPQRKITNDTEPKNPQPLIPRAGKNEISINGIARLVKHTSETIEKVLDKAGMVPVGDRRFGARIALAYDRESALAAIADSHLAAETAGENDTNRGRYCRERKIHEDVFDRITKKHGIKPYAKKWFGVRIVPAYRKDELDIAFAEYLATPEKDAEGIFLSSFVSKYGGNIGTVLQLIDGKLSPIGLRRSHAAKKWGGQSNVYDETELLRCLGEVGYYHPTGTRTIGATTKLINQFRDRRASNSGLTNIILNELSLDLDNALRNSKPHGGQTLPVFTLVDQQLLIDKLHRWHMRSQTGPTYLDDKTYANIRAQLEQEITNYNAERARRLTEIEQKQASGEDTKLLEVQLRVFYPELVLRLRESVTETQGGSAAIQAA